MQQKDSAEMLGFLCQALANGDPHQTMTEIDKQQQEVMAKQETLPMEMDEETKNWLIKCGVKFFDQVPDDELFQFVELPTGWKKIPATHDWSNGWLSMLVDDQGRERARIFYKPSHYDRHASLSPQPRYSFLENQGEETRKSTGSIAVTVMNGSGVLGTGEILYMTEPIPDLTERKERFRAYMKAKKQTIEWLNKNFPDWENPFAYWD